jgi:hypothetical protein
LLVYGSTPKHILNVTGISDVKLIVVILTVLTSMCSDDGDGDNENESGSENEEGGNAGGKKSSGEESSGDASDSDSSDMDVEDCDKRREGNRANFHFSLTSAEQCCGSGIREPVPF